MKTSEFIELALGFKDIGEHKRENGIIHFYDTQASLIATVSENEPAKMNTNYFRFGYMKKYSKLELLALLYEYATTPLEEREEPKKYKLKHKLIRGNDGYLNYAGSKKELIFSSETEIRDIRATATIQEWESLTEQTWEDLLLQFKAIEV